MIEFFIFSGEARIFITFILGICVLAQTLAMVLNFYRRRQTIRRVFGTLFEFSILCELLVFSLLFGRVLNGYKSGFVVPTGNENLRMLVFFAVSIFAIIGCIFLKNISPFIVIPAAVISLPIIENIMGRTFPWFFVAALIFFLSRSIMVCVSSIISIRTDISALSVIRAIDTLKTGVLFSEKNGNVLLSNHQMQNLMLAITGKVFRNSIYFYDTLLLNEDESRYKKAELEGQIIYLLPNGTAWMFTKTDILLRLKHYIHISAADVTEHWALTTELQLYDKELRRKGEDLKSTIANLHIISKERELESAKMRAHDILGQRLSMLMRTIQNEDNPDYSLLTSLSKGLLDELKREQRKTMPYDELKSTQQTFATIGVDIIFKGALPDNAQKASLFIDIIREACTNAVRHGLATQIEIRSEVIAEKYNLTISNNGHIPTTQITPNNGIRVMRKKVDAKGGSLDIKYKPLFTLSVVLPGGDQL